MSKIVNKKSSEKDQKSKSERNQTKTRFSDIRNIPPIMEEEVTNFCRPVNGLDPIPNLSDLYERIPEPMLIETSQTDEEFYKFQSSAKSKHRSLSLPPVRGNFILLNRMMNCSPLNNKFRSDRNLKVASMFQENRKKIISTIDKIQKVKKKDGVQKKKKNECTVSLN